MSQSALRRARVGEEVYVELQDDGGFNISWGVGATERQAADEAERRWYTTFGRGSKPTRKVVALRKQDAGRAKNAMPAWTGGAS